MGIVADEPRADSTMTRASNAVIVVASWESTHVFPDFWRSMHDHSEPLPYIVELISKLKEEQLCFHPAADIPTPRDPFTIAEERYKKHHGHVECEHNGHTLANHGGRDAADSTWQARMQV